MKKIVFDYCEAYIGSANLTGAGIGMKGKDKRNFKAGILTNDPAILEPCTEQSDKVWRGGHCKNCLRREAAVSRWHNITINPKSSTSLPCIIRGMEFRIVGVFAAVINKNVLGSRYLQTRTIILRLRSYPILAYPFLNASIRAFKPKDKGG